VTTRRDSDSVLSTQVVCRECETRVGEVYSSTVKVRNHVSWTVTPYQRKPVVLKPLTHVPKLILNNKIHQAVDNRYTYGKVDAVKNYIQLHRLL